MKEMTLSFDGKTSEMILHHIVCIFIYTELIKYQAPGTGSHNETSEIPKLYKRP